MKENRIESFSELEMALSNMTSLSEDIKNTFNEINSIYQSQSAGWSSANSRRESDKMIDYVEEANKIAKNIAEVSTTIQRFKTTTQNIDAQ